MYILSSNQRKHNRTDRGTTPRHADLNRARAYLSAAAGVCAWGAGHPDPKEVGAAACMLQGAAVESGRMASEIPPGGRQ